MHKFNLWFDGGCKPNPGQGYGSYEVSSKVESVVYQTKNQLIQFGFMTNNMAEYQALIHGAKKLWHDSLNGNVRTSTGIEIMPSRITLEIHSDSMLLVQQLNARWKCRVAHIKEQISEARLVLKEFGHWKLLWKPRQRNVERFGH